MYSFGYIKELTLYRYVCLETWSSVLFTFPGDYSKWSLDSSCEKKKSGGKIVTEITPVEFGV